MLGNVGKDVELYLLDGGSTKILPFDYTDDNTGGEVERIRFFPEYDGLHYLSIYGVDVYGNSGGGSIDNVYRLRLTPVVLPTFNFSVMDYRVAENAGTATVTLTPVTPYTETTTLYYDTINGTAIADSDYGQVNDWITFNPGETTKTLAVPLIDDTIDEPDQTILLRLHTAGIYSQDAATTMTLTIEDDDLPPSIAFNTATLTSQESGGSASVLVRLGAVSEHTITVNYATSNGTASAGSDYAATTGTLTFNPGETSKTFTIPILEDGAAEGNETIVINLVSPVNATLGTPTQATLTIPANDTITLSSAAYSVNEGVAVATLTAQLNATSAQTVTVGYATSNGTAQAGSDYTATSGTVTFAPNQLTKVFTIPISDDAVGEANESFTVTLSSPTNAGLGTLVTATVTILANDTLTTGNVSVHENAGTATVIVSLNAAGAQPVTVAYATSNGTAIAGSDYAAASGTLTFSPGQTAKNIVIPILEDTVGEPNETFIVTLSAPTNATLGSPATATVTINANDTLTAGNVSVHENVGNATVNVQLSGPSAYTVTVAYATSNGTASAGSDYAATSGTLTFTPGQTIKTFTIPITDDTLGEPNETVIVTLSSPTNAVVGTPATATLTINANDTINFSNASYSVNESLTSVVITVRLNAPSAQVVTVAYATSDGTATAGSDYAATNGTLTFSAGETAKTFTIPLIGDTVDEPNETVNLTLSAPTNAVLGTPTSVVLTIIDND